MFSESNIKNETLESHKIVHHRQHPSHNVSLKSDTNINSKNSLNVLKNDYCINEKSATSKTTVKKEDCINNENKNLIRNIGSYQEYGSTARLFGHDLSTQIKLTFAAIAVTKSTRLQSRAT